jgi:hypothetical protein
VHAAPTCRSSERGCGGALLLGKNMLSIMSLSVASMPGPLRPPMLASGSQYPFGVRWCPCNQLKTSQLGACASNTGISSLSCRTGERQSLHAAR